MRGYEKADNCQISLRDFPRIDWVKNSLKWVKSSKRHCRRDNLSAMPFFYSEHHIKKPSEQEEKTLRNTKRTFERYLANNETDKRFYIEFSKSQTENKARQSTIL